MQPTLSQTARNALAGIALHTGFSEEAVAAMWRALLRGGGTMAQFDHAEFGGPGQWMRGGMTMVSNLFDTALRDRVDALCDALAALMAQQPALADAALESGAGGALSGALAAEVDADGDAAQQQSPSSTASQMQSQSRSPSEPQPQPHLHTPSASQARQPLQSQPPSQSQSQRASPQAHFSTHTSVHGASAPLPHGPSSSNPSAAHRATPAARDPLAVRNWWPRDLHSPASTGAQNGMRYACFPAQRRLAVDRDGRVTVYDTEDHQIGGVAQQQGGRAGLVFTSQRGTVDLAQLRVVSPAPAEPQQRPAIELPARAAAAATAAPAAHQAPAGSAATPALATAPAPAAMSQPPSPSPPPSQQHPQPPPSIPPRQAPPPPHTTAVRSAGLPPAFDTVAPGRTADTRLHSPEVLLDTIDKLAALHQRGVLTAEEFAAKKTELLARL